MKINLYNLQENPCLMILLPTDNTKGILYDASNSHAKAKIIVENNKQRDILNKKLGKLVLEDVS